jgi:acyl carrier protein
MWLAYEILEWVQRAAGETLGMLPEQISADTDIVGELKADSLDVVELVMEIEDEFDLTIPDEDYDQFQTIADVVRYILRRRQGLR